MAVAESTTVDVSIQSVKPAAKEITVAYQTNTGEKSITLDVSRKAEISLNGQESDLDSLGGGMKAKVDYHKELAVVTKIEAVGSSHKLATPVVRLRLHITEFGDCTFSAQRTDQVAADDFEGTLVALPHLPGAKAWKGLEGKSRLVCVFDDEAQLNAAWQASHVSVDNDARTLVFRPVGSKRDELALFTLSHRVRLPATVVCDLAKHQRGTFAVKLLDYQWGVVHCETASGKESNTLALKAWWVDLDSEKSVPTDLFNTALTSLDIPYERKFRLPIPSIKIENPLMVELMGSDQPTTVARLEIRGQLVPMLGIQLAERDQVVYAAKVFPGGLAERAGIKMGDVIKSINGATPETKEDAVKMLGLLNFGEEAQLSIQRAGKNEELRFTAM
jgi:serine protease Do